MSFFKVPQWRNESYLEWVRHLGCRGCGIEGVINHAHHNIAERFGSSKASDAWSLPLCPTCHTVLHAGWQDWERENNTQDRHCLIILNRALVAGVLELNKKKAREVW